MVAMWPQQEDRRVTSEPISPERGIATRPDPDADPWATAAHTPSRFDLLSLVPLVAILTLVAIVWSVVWTVNRDKHEQAGVKLATDALWVEQTLRFQLNVDEDMLVTLVMDAANGVAPATLDARARTHVMTNAEVLSMVWHGTDGRVARALPGRGAPDDAELAALLLAADPPPSRPIYGSVRDDGLVTLGMRRPDGDGVLTATVALPIMLERHLPWWIAEQYGVEILASNDRVLARRQRLEPAPDSPSHAISFSPPLPDAVLKITAYQRPFEFHSIALLAVVVGLSAFAILSLLALFLSARRRRMAEKRLSAETAFRRSMEESLTVGLRAKDHDGRILFVNPAFCKMVGYPAHELIGRSPPMPYWDPAGLAQTQERHQKLAAGGADSQSFQTRFVTRDGDALDIQVYEAPLIDGRGVHRGWMGSVIDITEAKRAARQARSQDEAMARTGRLVTLGEMASTLAHELNQPLSAIASYAAGMLNLTRKPGADPELLQNAAGRMAQQADRAGQIISRIQDMVRKREPRFTPTRLDGVIAETLGFLQADAREHEVRLSPDIAEVPAVAADPILIQQVLINLFRNGMEAMADQRHGDDILIRLRPEGQVAVIEVIDRGSGIAPELAEHLFDAFISTKSQGMGMGLKICRSIIELHHGKLTNAPAPGGGTVFRVELPLPTGDTAHEPREMVDA